MMRQCCAKAVVSSAWMGGGECLRLVVASSAARYADAGLPHGGEVVLQHFAREWRGKAGEDFQRFQRLP